MYWSVALQSTGLWVVLSLAAGHLTEQEKSTIVDMHNEFRSKVQPSAAFMHKVVWDETLSLVAENHSAKCIVDHNPLLKELGMGENIYSDHEPFNATKTMMEWFGEHEDYNFETNNCDEDRICDNYIQMVWAKSSRIGCAAHVCDPTENLGPEKVTLFVCNYYPSGDIKTQKPYESGAPCSKCPNTPACEDNMCVADDTKGPTVSPERPRMTTEPAEVPEQPTHKQVKIVTGVESKPNHGSKMNNISAPLLMLVWLLVL